jgi:hypothetical protein
MGWMVLVSTPGGKIFLFMKTSRPAVRPMNPLTKWVPRFFSEVKRPGREVDHSAPSNPRFRGSAYHPPVHSWCEKRQIFLIIIIIIIL